MTSFNQPPPSDKSYWVPSPWFLAQVNHQLAGLMIFPFIFCAHWASWLPVACIMAFATIKEYVLDLGILQPLVDFLVTLKIPFTNIKIPRWLVSWLALEQDSVAGSTVDFTFYAIGTLMCWLAIASFLWGAVPFAAVLLGVTIWDIASQNGLNLPEP